MNRERCELSEWKQTRVTPKQPAERHTGRRGHSSHSGTVQTQKLPLEACDSSGATAGPQPWLRPCGRTTTRAGLHIFTDASKAPLKIATFYQPNKRPAAVIHVSLNEILSEKLKPTEHQYPSEGI